MHDLVSQDDVKILIATLRTVYASQFNKHFPSEGKSSISMQLVEQIASNTLVGVWNHQFQRGLVLLSTSGKTYMPSFAEFRAMCIGQDWWNAEKAWVRSCEYTKIMKHKKTILADKTEQYQEITTIAKFALDQVFLLIQDGEMYRAKEEFSKLYAEYLAEAQLKGRIQEWYQEPLLLKWDNDQKEHVPVSDDVAKQKLEDLKKKLNVKNRTAHVPQKLKSKDEPLNTLAMNEWPDPFDQRESYLSQCELDGHKVPNSIRRQFGGGV